MREGSAWPVAALLGLALCAASTGCYVRVYQPLSGLHRPVVVDPRLANFEDLRLTVRCVPGDFLNPQEANALCQKVGTLFENQGAEVSTTSEEYASTDDTGTAPDAEGEGEAPAPEPTDLTLELRARELHHSNNLLSWIFCLGTFTVLPAVTESTFAQDVTIRDGTGFLLVSEPLEGRMVIRFGFGSWAANKLLDFVWREDEDKLMGDAVNQDLSTDLYRQLSQLMFNAEMQWKVLQETPSGRPTGPRR